MKTVIITGKGRGFCSGGDVNETIGRLIKAETRELLEFTRLSYQVIKNIRALRKTGNCLGAGQVRLCLCQGGAGRSRYGRHARPGKLPAGSGRLEGIKKWREGLIKGSVVERLYREIRA